MTPETDPFALLAIADDSVWPAGVDPLKSALSHYDPENPAPLISLLQSEDTVVRSRGLFLFGDLGKKAFAALDQALKSIDHPSVYARSHLMDGIISYPRQLTPDQASKILGLACDNEALVREKVVAFIGAIRLEILEAAIALLDEPLRHDHIRGVQSLLKRPENIQALFDGAISNLDVRSIYALASIERMAREGVVMAPPEYKGDSYLPSAVVGLVNMLIARRERAKGTKFSRRG